MTHKLFDRVRETNTVTGTGNVTLGGAVAGYRTFASVFTGGDTTWYCIVDSTANQFEIGSGTFNPGAVLSRNTVLASSNANALVNFAGNVCDCFVDFPAYQAFNIQPTIAALRANTIPASPDKTITVKGYYGNADGGEGQFYYNATDTTSTDNGGTIIVDTLNQRWYRITGGTTVNIKWFGAKGNGTTDDTTAIQNCINVAQNLGYEVLIPIGIFVVSSTLNVTAALTITGINPGIGPGIVTSTNASIILCAPSFTSGDVIAVNSYYSFLFRRIQIAGALNLGFTSACPRTSGAGLKIIGPVGHINFGTVIECCAFSGLTSGVIMTRGQEYNILRDSYFQAWGNNNPAAGFDNGGSTVESGIGQITGNHFFGNPSVSNGTSCMDCHCGYGFIIRNKFLGASFGIRCVADQGVNIGNLEIALNSFEEITVQGVLVSQTGTNAINSISIVDNQFSNLDQQSFQSHIYIAPQLGGGADRLTNVVISKNRFYSIANTTNACFISVNASNVLISENLGTVAGLTMYGIIVNASSGFTSVLDNQLIAVGGAFTGIAGYLIQSFTLFRDLRPSTFTFSHLSALTNCTDGSQIYISDGHYTSPTNFTVTNGGSGCQAWKMSGAWLTITT